MFVNIILTQWSKIFAEKIFAGDSFTGTFFADRVKKSAKIAKIRTRKNLVPHGRWAFCMNW